MSPTEAKLAIDALIVDAIRRGKLRPEGLDGWRADLAEDAKKHPDRTVERLVRMLADAAPYKPENLPVYFVIWTRTTSDHRRRFHVEAGTVEAVPQWVALPHAPALVPFRGAQPS